jgi:hypothetical protein
VSNTNCLLTQAVSLEPSRWESFIINSIDILNTENRGWGKPLWSSVTPNRILNGLIASLSNILTDSSETNFIVISIITSFLQTNEDDTHYSVYSIVLNLAYKVCRLQLTKYGLAFVYLFNECRKVSFSSMCP